MKIAIRYEPERLALGDKPAFISATDGDTPLIQVPIRMLGMGTPELHYAGASESNPGKFDGQFDRFLDSAAARNLDPGLRDYLAQRLHDQACTRHIAAGRAAYDHFQQISAERLRRTSDKTGREP